MASDTQNAPTNGGAGPGGESGPPLVVNAQYIKDFSFENPKGAESLANPKSPEINVHVDVRANRVGEQMFEVELEVRCKALRDQETAFIAELVYAGLFTLQGIPSEHMEPVLLIECPRLLFPFARAVLANISREAGFPPLLLHPVDFLQMYQNARVRRGEGAGSQAMAPGSPPAGHA